MACDACVENKLKRINISKQNSQLMMHEHIRKLDDSDEMYKIQLNFEKRQRIEAAQIMNEKCDQCLKEETTVTHMKLQKNMGGKHE